MQRYVLLLISILITSTHCNEHSEIFQKVLKFEAEITKSYHIVQYNVIPGPIHTIQTLIRYNHNRTLLHFAVAENQQDVVRWLLEEGKSDVNANDYKDCTPLLYSENEEMAQLLLEHGATINEVNYRNQTPLYIAAREGKKKMVEFLLKKGANVHSKDHNGNTALHHAATPEIAQLLIQAGAKVDERDACGCIPLHYVTYNVVQLLLSQGKDLINLRDARGSTPLHYAAYAGELEKVRLLLSEGADSTIVCESNETPLHKTLAMRKYHATDNKFEEIVKALLEAGVNPNVANNILKQTPLHLACSDYYNPYVPEIGFYNKGIIQLLLNAGANVNMADDRGDTSLHKVFMSYSNTFDMSKVELAKMLLRKGAYLNVRNTMGYTPLEYANKETLQALWRGAFFLMLKTTICEKIVNMLFGI